MFSAGFIDEVQLILAMGYNRELKPLQSIGYKEVIQYLLEKLIINLPLKILSYQNTTVRKDK